MVSPQKVQGSIKPPGILKIYLDIKAYQDISLRYCRILPEYLYIPQAMLRQAPELDAFGGEFSTEDSSRLRSDTDDHRQPSSKA
jgi:hypothetical protein